MAALDYGATAEDPWYNGVAKQRHFLERLPKQSLVEVADEEHWLRILLGEGENDLLYYYGHTDNGLAALWDLTANNSPLELADVESKWNRKKHHDPDAHLVEYPIVFLNSCRNLSFSGWTYHSFADLFVAQGVSAMVGTESSVHPDFAAEVGVKVLAGLAPKSTSRSLGRIVWELKRDALRGEKGNPLVLLYSVVGNYQIRTCPMSTISPNGERKSTNGIPSK